MIVHGHFTVYYLPLDTDPLYNPIVPHYMSRVIRKPVFCICENKGANQLHGDHAADQLFSFST